METYPLARGQVLHLDLYRLDGPEGLEGLAVRDEWRAGTLLLVEWPERAGSALPPPDLRVELSMPPSGAGPAGAGTLGAGTQQPGRMAVLEASTALGQDWLSRINSL